MARAATTVPKIGLRATAGKRVLRFGLVNVGVSMGPALDASARVAGKMLDPELHTPLKQQYVNDDGDVVARTESVKGYPTEAGFVILEDDEVPAPPNDGTIQLVANIEESEIPHEWIDKTYLAWPTDSTQDEGYMLVAAYLRDNGKAFIDTTVDHGTTKAFAVRWSSVYGSLVTQTLAYHAQVRWANVDTVKHAVSTLSDPAPAMATMADQVFGTMEDTFAWDEVQDEYGIALEAAIAEKASTGAVTLTPTPTGGEMADTLMAALEASLAKPSTPETCDPMEVEA